jgi:hypothetical protein
LWLNADEPDIPELLENATSTRLRAYFTNYSYIFNSVRLIIKSQGRFIDFKEIPVQVAPMGLISRIFE